MCGITGFYTTHPSFSDSDLQHMTQVLTHRGPDTEGFFSDGLCRMGHRRLSILDLSEKANQPMYSQDERYAMVFNGEIYNFQELSKQIERPLRTRSDSEVILELFTKNGPRFVYQLNGMFSIAIYDKLERRLFLFRDRLGIKPLYYYWTGTESEDAIFVFGSELKSILLAPELKTDINVNAVANFLHLGYIPSPQSIYQYIHKMKPGTWLMLDKNGLLEENYWQLEKKLYDHRTQSKLTLVNKESEAKKQLHKLLRSSVSYRLISDVPLGIFLSGGIDSSLVTALAAEASDAKVRTFSIGFEDSKFNESAYARSVADKLNTEHTEFMVSQNEARDLIPRLIDIYDEPFADSSFIPTYMVSALARQDVKVALGGDGGDELFLGYGMYQWANRLESPFWKNTRYLMSPTFKILGGNSFQKAGHLLNYGNSREIASHIFSQEQFLFSQKELKNLIIPQNQVQIYTLSDVPRSLKPVEKQALYDISYYLPDDLLVKVDRSSMQHGLEVRVPLLDHRIVEFAINLHPQLRQKGNIRKYLLKQILFDYLPPEMFDRPKQGFSIPLADWMQKDLSFLIDDYLNESIVKDFGIIRPELVENMKKKFKKGNRFYYNRLWALIVLHMFLYRKGK